ncbi:MAG: isoprenyl transferase [Eubacteriales bacterium]|nr:isoprenyl transferase [Eubacteriales bacterium]
MPISYPLPDTIDPSRLPRHIAIIMDGNGRWAKQHKLQIALGHRAGTENLREIIRNCSDIGVKALSLYAFSTENWNRSKSEVDALMQLILDFFDSEIDELCEKRVHITILGDKAGLPDTQRVTLEAAEQRTAANDGLYLNIAVNYGGRAELVRAAKALCAEVQKGSLSLDQIDEQAFSDRLYTGGMPDVDLLIRTSGEMRLSNFLLYQCSYAEFIFPEKLWPDFHVPDLHECIRVYQSRDRRYGARRAEE